MKRILILSIILATLITSIHPSEPAGTDSVVKGDKSQVHRLYSPIRLTFTPGGDLLVSDYRLQMILTIDKKSSQTVNWFPVKGKPLGVAYANGRIYVGNETKGCIEVYNPSGKENFKIGGTMGPVKQPTDIAVDTKKGHLFVVDGYSKSVKVFSLKGEKIRSFPSDSPQPGILANPTGIALDRTQARVFVSDYGDPKSWIYARVQIFSYDGVLLGSISGKGGGMISVPRFSRPQGLTIDEAGNVFLVDCYSCEIMVFNASTGTLLKTLGGFGSEPGQLLHPLDIVMDQDTKDIFVTNNRSAEIEIFRQGGQL